MATPQELNQLRDGPRTPREQIWFDRYAHHRLEAWRRVQDPLADRCLENIAFQRPSGLLDEVERRAAEEGGVYQAFLDHCTRCPAGWTSSAWNWGGACTAGTARCRAWC